MGRTSVECRSREDARGFIAGMNWVNDSSVRVLGAYKARDGAVLLELEDDDSPDDEKLRLPRERDFREISVDRLCK